MLQDRICEGGPLVSRVAISVLDHADWAQRGWRQADTIDRPIGAAAQGSWLPGKEPAVLTGPGVSRDQGLSSGARAPVMNAERGRREAARGPALDERRRGCNQQEAASGQDSEARTGGNSRDSKAGAGVPGWKSEADAGVPGLKSEADAGVQPAWARALCLALQRGSPLPLSPLP